MDSLLVSTVPRALETKTKLFGFELGDLLLVFVYMSLTNLIFGATSLKFPIVWIGTAVFALSLQLIKRGKPDHYIEHLSEFFRTPGVFAAGTADLKCRPYLPS